MYQDLLPVGSVVLLKNGEKRLMVCGRVVAGGEEDEIYDYVGCFFPEGVISSSELFFFNHEDVESIFFIGLQDEEEIAFRTEVLSELDDKKLSVVDGEIVVSDKESE